MRPGTLANIALHDDGSRDATGIRMVPSGASLLLETAALSGTRPVIIRKTFSLGIAEIFHLGHVSARVLMKGVR